MKVLVIGSGGREHALCWAVAKSPRCTSLYCAPGNAGIAELAECVAIAAEDTEGLVDFARDSAIDFVIVGPEAPLVGGLVDRLEDVGILAFGPSAGAAELEGSKGFMKDLCSRYGIPTAEYASFDEPDAAKQYILRQGAPIVVKADGLAAGKGVMVCRNRNEAYAAIDHIMIERAFGDAGAEVVIESASKARRRASSPSSTARTRCHWSRPRTTSAPTTATPVPIPAAWGPTRRRRWSHLRSPSESWIA